jgi:hypothetical protein
MGRWELNKSLHFAAQQLNLFGGPKAASHVNDLHRHLSKIESGLPLQSAPHLRSSVHWTPSENFPVHRWFRYREGFSPYLLEHFRDSKRRLDPFCGCGTTLLESARQGVHSYGVDLNPLATFVAKVKTRRYTGSDRDRFLKCSIEAIENYRNVSQAPVPSYPLLSQKLFLSENLELLLRLKSFVLTCKPEKVQKLLLLAWLSILEDCSNAFKEGNGLKYKNKKRKPGKYETISNDIWIPKHFGNSIPTHIERLWNSKCQQIAEDIEGYRFAPGFSPQIRTGSCLNKDTIDFNESFDLAIFSPPYANRFDYFEAFKMELWMGDFVKSSSDMAVLRSNSMRNNLAAKRIKDIKEWRPLTPFLESMDDSASSVSMGIKDALKGYFSDTRILLQNLKQFLSHKGRVVIVIGNSAYAKSIIPSDILVARIGEEEGYKIKAIMIARDLHVSSQQRSILNSLSSYMRESVVVLEK